MFHLKEQANANSIGAKHNTKHTSTSPGPYDFGRLIHTRSLPHRGVAYKMLGLTPSQDLRRHVLRSLAYVRPSHPTRGTGRWKLVDDVDVTVGCGRFKNILRSKSIPRLGFENPINFFFLKILYRALVHPSHIVSSIQTERWQN